MSLDKPIEEIVEADLQYLVTSGISEGREIDFKRDLYGSTDADRKEFLNDVSSFANTAEGHLLRNMRQPGII